VARIFISHSSANNEWALRVRDWLVENGWSDIFLDLDPVRGITAGQRWLDALRDAAHRCEVVVVLASREWLASPFCKSEVDAARLLGKRIILALIGLPASELPADMTAEQWVDVAGDPEGFPRLRVGLKRAGLDPSTFPFAAGRRPYPGLAPLEEDDAAIFFGRDAQIIEAIDKMRGMARNGVKPMLVILGASGAGKSSFLRAGLWPRLKRDDLCWFPVPTIRPERAVIAGEFGLARALEEIGRQEPFAAGLAKEGLPRSRGDIRQFLDQDETNLARILAAIRNAAQLSIQPGAASPLTLVVPIDQGEELFNEDGAVEARKFMRMLSHATAKDKGHVLVVIALRSDAFPRLQQDALFSEFSKEVFALDEMLPGAYQAVIEGPAQLVKPTPLKIDPKLVDALLRDVTGQDALPLLAFTLQRLHQDYGAEGALNFAQYEKIGGLKGVIEHAAQQAFAEHRDLPQRKEERAALLRAAFIPHLARVNEAGEFIRRVATRAEIPAHTHVLIDRFTDARLLIKDHRSIAGAAVKVEVVEVAHEALLREWRDLHDLLVEEKEFLMAKSQLEKDVNEWRDTPQNRKAGALLSGNKLARARGWFVERSDKLTPEERQYIQASISQADRTRRRVALIGAAVFCVVLAFAVLAAFQWTEANGQRVEAERKTVAAQLAAAAEEKARQEAETQRSVAEQKTLEAETNLRQSQARQARLVSEQARREYRAGNETVALLLALESLPEFGSERSADRPYVPEGEAVLREILGRSQPLRIAAPAGGVTALAVSADGALLATGSKTGEVVLWDAASGAKRQTLAGGHRGEIASIVFDKAGQRLLTASLDGTARLWSVPDGQSLALLAGESPATLVRFSPDESRIIVGHADRRADRQQRDNKRNQLIVYRLNGSAAEVDWRATEFGAEITQAFLSADNSRVIALACRIHVWDFPANGWKAPANVEKKCASHGAYVPAGTTLAVSFPYEAEAILYKADNLDEIGRLQGAKDKGNSIALSPEGSLVATGHGNEIIGSNENIARIWSVSTLKPVHVLKGHRRAVMHVAFTSDGRLLVSASHEGTLRLWHAESGTLLNEYVDEKAKEGAATLFDLSANGRYAALAAGAAADAVQLWNLQPDLKTLVDQAREKAPRCLTQVERATLDLPGAIPSWCAQKQKWPTTETKTAALVDPLISLTRVVAELDLKPDRLPKEPQCLAHPRYGPLLLLQNLFVQVQNEYLDHWPDARLLFAAVSREPDSMKSIQSFVQRFGRGEYKDFYSRNRIGILVDYLIQYYDKYRVLDRRQKDLLDMEEYERQDKKLVLRLPPPEHACLGKIGMALDESATFESLHHWFYAFWHRRTGEKNDAIVLDLLKWVKRTYG
jgi:WD40 repeat protein